jgi:hypothetical protein
MKMLIVAGILIASQIALGQARRMTIVEARARVERSATFKEIEAARRAGKDIAADPRLMERINKMMDLTLKDVASLSGSQSNSLIKLLTISPKEVMAEVARLASIAKDPASSAKEKAMSATAISLIAKSAHTIRSLVRNSAEARAEEAKIAKIIEISSKISSLNFGQSSKSFVASYEKALAEGKTIEQAVRIASKGKFNEKQLRECE